MPVTIEPIKPKIGQHRPYRNEAVTHRVVPYIDDRRAIHRTSIAHIARPGQAAPQQELQRLIEAVI